MSIPSHLWVSVKEMLDGHGRGGGHCCILESCCTQLTGFTTIKTLTSVSELFRAVVPRG